MDATLMISAPATPAPASAAPSSASAGSAAQTARGVDSTAEPGNAQTTPNGRIFSGLMRDLLPTHERQDVAAAAETANSATADLKTEILGSQLNVITTSNAQPDPVSLTAFAKAQGLDEAAVKVLFGQLATAGKDTTDAAPPQPQLNVITDPTASPVNVAWLASQLSAEISIQVSSAKIAKTTSQPPAQTTLTSMTGDTAAPQAMGWSMMANVPQLTSPPVSVAIDANTPAAPNTLSVPPQSDPALGPLKLSPSIKPLPALTLPPLPLKVLSLAALQQTPAPSNPTASALASTTVQSILLPVALPTRATSGAAPINLTAPVQPDLDTPLAAAEGLASLAPANPSTEDAMRIRLVPAWSVVTQQLTQMSGTAMTATWGALTATTLGAPTRSVALDLSDSAATEDKAGDGVSAADSRWSNQATNDLNRPGTVNNPLAGPTPVPGMAQTLRQEHFQQLADRLGQAMAERLQSQIARGEWKLQMRLNPANLGRIDVELDMHAKGLDAVFRSENPLTRELMVQSMPKLKDTLSQSGMAVASVWVNSDAGRQSDGNPTPQKDRSNVKDTPTSAQADIGSAPATKIQRSSDGFDVLA